MQDFAVKETVLKGIGASPGICIGKVYLVDQDGVDVVEKYYINGDDLQNEKNRFKTAVKKSRDELRETKESLRNLDHDFHVRTTDLIGADRMAKVADDMVERGRIDSRSALADARLDYGKPYTYKYHPDLKAAEGE